MLIPMLELLGGLFAGAGLWVTGASYRTLPDRIPIHFGFRLEPDAWAGRPAIWLLPAMGAMLTVMLLALSQIVPAGKGQLLLAAMCAELSAMFLWILWGQILVARGERARLGSEFWAILALVLLTPAFIH